MGLESATNASTHGELVRYIERNYKEAGNFVIKRPEPKNFVATRAKSNDTFDQNSEVTILGWCVGWVGKLQPRKIFGLASRTFDNEAVLKLLGIKKF